MQYYEVPERDHSLKSLTKDEVIDAYVSIDPDDIFDDNGFLKHEAPASEFQKNLSEVNNEPGEDRFEDEQIQADDKSFEKDYLPRRARDHDETPEDDVTKDEEMAELDEAEEEADETPEEYDDFMYEEPWEDDDDDTDEEVPTYEDEPELDDESDD